jgi:hypothetical protein
MVSNRKSLEKILVCKRVTYYAHKDEDAFFEWIKKIPAIVKFEGVHDECAIAKLCGR